MSSALSEQILGPKDFGNMLEGQDPRIFQKILVYYQKIFPEKIYGTTFDTAASMFNDPTRIITPAQALEAHGLEWKGNFPIVPILHHDLEKLAHKKYDEWHLIWDPGFSPMDLWLMQQSSQFMSNFNKDDREYFLRPVINEWARKRGARKAKTWATQRRKPGWHLLDFAAPDTYKTKSFMKREKFERQEQFIRSLGKGFCRAPEGVVIESSFLLSHIHGKETTGRKWQHWGHTTNKDGDNLRLWSAYPLDIGWYDKDGYGENIVACIEFCSIP